MIKMEWNKVFGKILMKKVFKGNKLNYKSLNPIVWHGMYKNGCKIGNW